MIGAKTDIGVEPLYTRLAYRLALPCMHMLILHRSRLSHKMSVPLLLLKRRFSSYVEASF